MTHIRSKGRRYPARGRTGRKLQESSKRRRICALTVPDHFRRSQLKKEANPAVPPCGMIALAKRVPSSTELHYPGNSGDGNIMTLA